MSNPVKNAEIEDVLSSIRRLVSESHVDVARPVVRQEQRVEPPVSEPPVPKATPDRLVLSPALRVEEEVAEVAVEQTSPVQDTPFANSLKEDILPLRETLPSFLRQRLEASEGPDLDALEEDDADLPVEAEAELEIEEVSFEEEASEDEGEQGNTLKFPAPEELVFETARGPEMTAEMLADVAPTNTTFDANDSRPWEIEGERLAEWHSVRADEPEHFEPDGPEDGDNAGTPVATLNWEDHESDVSVEADVTPSEPQVHKVGAVEEQITETVVEDFSESDETIDAQQYDAVLDEEMLRELVGEIVRQELQGPLGERITRNVRKLVRREINRALTARNFNDS